MMTGQKLIPGATYCIKKIQSSLNRAYRHRLLSMGLLPGEVFQVVRKAPFGDTIQILIKGFALSLRSHELAEVLVERVNSPLSV